MVVPDAAGTVVRLDGRHLLPLHIVAKQHILIAQV